jgi:hypothetical protein
VSESRWYVDFVVKLERDDLQRLRAAGAELPNIVGDNLGGWFAHAARHTAVLAAESAIDALDIVREALSEDLARTVREWEVQSATIRERSVDEHGD